MGGKASERGVGLRVAASRGQQVAFSHLLAKGVAPSDPSGYMQHAVQSGSMDMVVWLRSQSWHTQEADVAGLCVALIDRKTILDEWIKDPSILNHIAPQTNNALVSTTGKCPLLCAAFHSIDWVKPLMETGADPNFIADPNNGRSVLHIACSNLGVNPATLREMLTASENIDIEDNHGNTPLFLAAKAGKTNTMLILADMGASVDHRNTQGESLVDIAKSFPLMGLSESAATCAGRLMAQREASQLQDAAPLSREAAKPRL